MRKQTGSALRRGWSSLRLWAVILAVAFGLTGCYSRGGDDPAPTTAAPAITTQPLAATATAGQTATFSVAASGAAPFTYQWKRNSADITGATNASYALTTALADSGVLFSVVVSNSAGSATSTAAALTVNAPPAAPTISSQPAAATVQVGQTAAFAVLATGTAPLTYQWQSDGTAITGATGASYTTAATALADSGANYRVLVSNAAGSVTSASAALTVLPSVAAPVITVAPQAQSVRENSSATLSVAASGTAPFTYRWLKNGAAIAGVNAATYTTPALAFADATALWAVEVSNSAGTATSNAVQIAVTAVPAAITAQPQAVSVTTGQTATFTVTASGSAPLAYQWRRNGSAITGATAASYTTAATALADDGALYSVVVNNAAAVPATSNSVRLTVAAAAVAPSFTTAPAGLTASVGQSVTFTAAASGTAPIAYQWRRNGADIAGASAATYVISAATLADNGARFSVRASNTAGQVTSTEVVLTVNAATSVLAGRAWTAGQLLETNDQPVIARAQGIDDLGRAMVVFLKSDGTRNVLYATRGTAGAAPAAPSWSVPQVIDLTGSGGLTNNMTESSASFGLSVAPGGNAVAFWVSTGNCVATTYATSGTCNYLYAARYLVTSNTWEAPALVADVPFKELVMGINDRGDTYGLLPGWLRVGTTSYNPYWAVVWRANGSTAYTQRTFSEVSLTGSPELRMDNSGNLLFVSQAAQNSTTDIVAYRGTLAAGFGAQQVLDNRGAAATLRAVATGLNGQQVVVWYQNNGTQSTYYAAASTSATGAFVLQELVAVAPTVAGINLTIDDSGNALLMNRYEGWQLRWVGGVWQDGGALPAGTPDSSFLSCSHARNGNFLCLANNILGIDGDSSMWVTYDAARNVLVQPRVTTNPGSGYALGFNVSTGQLGLSAPLLSVSGAAVVTMQNRYDVLPTPAAPAGDGRSVTNLWGAFLR